VLVNTVKSAGSRRLRVVTAVALALALGSVAVIMLWLAGGLAGTSSRTTGLPSAGAGPASPAAAARDRAAAWITAQVSSDVMVACYPRMCAALQEQGVAAGQLMPLRSAAASPLGASVLVTSQSAGGQSASQYAPALIASFGSGGNRIEVRAVESGGSALVLSAARSEAGGSKSVTVRWGSAGKGWASPKSGQVISRLRCWLVIAVAGAT